VGATACQHITDAGHYAHDEEGDQSDRYPDRQARDSARRRQRFESIAGWLATASVEKLHVLLLAIDGAEIGQPQLTSDSHSARKWLA
jgi:hypothetical protein